MFWNKSKLKWKYVYEEFEDSFLGESFTNKYTRFRINQKTGEVQEYSYGMWIKLEPQKVQILLSKIKDMGDYYVLNSGLKDESLDIRRAKFVYEASRLHAIALQCPVIPNPWDKREKEFKEQFIQLIDDLVSGRRSFEDPESAHDSWVKAYLDMGWKYGEEYDPINKVHPDLVPYNELHPKEKIKDEVFMKLVEFAKKYIWESPSIR